MKTVLISLFLIFSLNTFSQTGTPKTNGCKYKINSSSKTMGITKEPFPEEFIKYTPDNKKLFVVGDYLRTKLHLSRSNELIEVFLEWTFYTPLLDEKIDFDMGADGQLEFLFENGNKHKINVLSFTKLSGKKHTVYTSMGTFSLLNELNPFKNLKLIKIQMHWSGTMFEYPVNNPIILQKQIKCIE